MGNSNRAAGHDDSVSVKKNTQQWKKVYPARRREGMGVVSFDFLGSRNRRSWSCFSRVLPEYWRKTRTPKYSTAATSHNKEEMSTHTQLIGMHVPPGSWAGHGIYMSLLLT